MLTLPCARAGTSACKPRDVALKPRQSNPHCKEGSPMKIPARGIEDMIRMLLVSAMILGINGRYHCARAQTQETILFEEDFDDGQMQDWELEPGWKVTNGVLSGTGHFWAWPTAGPWRDFRLRFRLRLEQGVIHLVYRLIGFLIYNSKLQRSKSLPPKPLRFQQVQQC